MKILERISFFFGKRNKEKEQSEKTPKTQNRLPGRSSSGRNTDTSGNLAIHQTFLNLTDPGHDGARKSGNRHDRVEDQAADRTDGGIQDSGRESGANWSGSYSSSSSYDSSSSSSSYDSSSSGSDSSY